jgi:hypothetical protein
MDLSKTITYNTKVAAENIGFNDFNLIQNVIPTGELRKTCTLGVLSRWIKNKYHLYVETNYNKSWGYTLKWCEGYGVETFIGEFLYVDSNSNFETEEIAFDAGLQRALEEIKHILEQQ